MFYYNVKVEITLEADSDGKRGKRRMEYYLVHAESVTDAEAKIAQDFTGFPQDWEVVSVVQTKITKVLE